MAEKVTNPRRVRARTKVPGGYKSVHRPGRWGNPYAVEEHGRAGAIKRYEEWLDNQLAADPSFLEPLRGYNVGCFCALDVACHGDVILRRLYEPPSGTSVNDADPCNAKATRVLRQVHCLGLSEPDFADDIRLARAGFDVPQRCYVCKRQEGDSVVSATYFADDEDPSIATPEIHLFDVARANGDVTFYFKLCQECVVLLERDAPIDGE